MTWLMFRLEDQAFDRAHRLGQTKDVRIYKLTVEETVEDREGCQRTQLIRHLEITG